MNRMSIEEMKKHEWVVSWSGGKDSTATIILMHEYQIPIKEIVYVRLMYDESIPATLPIMSKFVDDTIDVFKDWGYNVNILKGDRTADYYVNKVYRRPRYKIKNGSPYGITAFSRKACLLSSVKVRTISNYQKGCMNYEMIGYAADEGHRLNRLNGLKYSVLLELGIAECEAYSICKNYHMLSPLYDLGLIRDGCWFCPNAAKAEREYIKNNYSDLYKKIIEAFRMVRFDVSEIPYYNNWIADIKKDLRTMGGKGE